MKPFSELDNNLEYHFYDHFNERNLDQTNSIRLQYLKRISDNEFNPYQSSNGLDLVNENDIIREENNLHDQLMRHQQQNTSCCDSLSRKQLATAAKNDKRIFYNPTKLYWNPKYERKPNNDNICNHFNSQLNNQTNLTSLLANQLANNSNYLIDRSELLNYDDQTECDLKFSNSNKINRMQDSMMMNLNKLQNKPPTGKKLDTSFNKSRLDYAIVDTKL